MSCNKFRPHVLVLPEDDANSQLATGFVLGVRNDRNIQILPAAGGWRNVCEIFVSEHIKGMNQYPTRYIILLLDFDDEVERGNKIAEKIPENLIDRVFMLGTKSEPEALRSAGLGSFEEIGKILAKECREGSREIWSHPLLNDNAHELIRLEKDVRGFLF